MALFREHVSVGAIAGAVGVTVLYFYALVTDPLLLALLFLVTTISSFVPDLDSDSGVPFYVMFGLFTLACTSATLFWTLSHYKDSWYALIGVPLVTMLAVWFIGGEIFKNFTKHRGMMHSIPMMLITGLLVYLAAEHFEAGEALSMWFAVAAALGFATHLLLDEFHSEITFDGIPFNNKKSLGTALKLFSQSRFINIFTYLLLVVLLYTVFIQ